MKERPELPFLEVIKTVTIRNNRWRCDHGWDIDLDDGSTSYLIQNNLCLNGGLKNREGYNRIVENNIMVNNSFHPHVWYQNSSDVFKHNVVFTSYKPIGMPEVWGKQIDSNFYHQAGQKTGIALELQGQSKQDQHSSMGDALFVDPEKGDYRVKENSPALKTGFKNFPMTGFGVVSPALRKIARQPVFPRPVPTAKTAGRSGAIAGWLGVSVRNILGHGEMSAYGLAGETGVLVLDIPHGSPVIKSGMQKDDVIVGINSVPVKELKDLLNAALPKSGAHKVEVVRNQKSLFYEVIP
ncbi:serine endoprotease [compost metagenome]